MKDFLLPIIGKNRNEILLIEYEGFLKNMTECLILQMKYKWDYYENRFPAIKDYFMMKPIPLYNSTELFSRRDILKVLDSSIEDNEIDEIIESCESIDVNGIRVDTMFEFALKELAMTDFVKEIHIVKANQFYPEELEYLMEVVFPSNIHSKINLYNGDIDEEIVSIHPTTIFSNSNKNICQIFDSMESEEDRKKILFLYRSQYKNMKLDTTNGLLIPDRNIDDRFKKKGIQFLRMRVPSNEIEKLQDALG